MIIKRIAADEPAARRLIEAMGDELALRYGDGGLSPASPEQFLPPGTFLVAELDGVAAGCGGLRPYGMHAGEVKRMYVDPSARGPGIGRAVLAGLVGHARESGMRRLLLETGTEQPEALGLYESEGWMPIAPFGHYADDPRTRCYGLTL